MTKPMFYFLTSPAARELVSRYGEGLESAVSETIALYLYRAAEEVQAEILGGHAIDTEKLALISALAEILTDRA